MANWSDSDMGDMIGVGAMSSPLAVSSEDLSTRPASPRNNLTFNIKQKEEFRSIAIIPAKTVSPSTASAVSTPSPLTGFTSPPLPPAEQLSNSPEMIVKAKESDAGPSFSRTRLVVGSNPDSLFTKLARVVADDECEEIEYQGKVVREIAIAEQSSEEKEQKAEQWGIRLSQESCHDLVKMVIASNVTQLEVVYT